MLKKVLALAITIAALGTTAVPVSARPQSKYLTLAAQTSDPNQLYLFGQQALVKYEFDDAVVIFQKVLQSNPTPEIRKLALLSTVMAYKTLGYINMRISPEKAIVLLKKAVAITSEDADVFDKLGYSYCHQQVRQYSNCMAAYTKAIEVSNHDPGSYFSRGHARLGIPGQKRQGYLDMLEAVRRAKAAGNLEEAKIFAQGAVLLGMPVSITNR